MNEERGMYVSCTHCGFAAMNSWDCRRFRMRWFFIFESTLVAFCYPGYALIEEVPLKGPLTSCRSSSRKTQLIIWKFAADSKPALDSSMLQNRPGVKNRVLTTHARYPRYYAATALRAPLIEVSLGYCCRKTRLDSEPQQPTFRRGM